ncbi:molybdopterin/thiamine biosynthesis adenylyltransferase [Allocatelliglobosispora scoriae]|uniref:Molybdopterin/thiamine biosynthesis adenylyltransferase n=1 Tax=Allocatelliglobosispora scoriae TaxID=643052 RepID=A0A841C2Z7_9ACTN|nr:ThiF family adenylyltransferase [Allocatelliglobosispora scoriae]MBB5873330.1 molybdopterin/thiamine biosynthesis adenylyltransferase [Allocatelliglobosispora scoriae]
MTIVDMLARHKRVGTTRAWQPEFFRLPADQKGFAGLLGSHRVREVCDTIDQQVDDLVATLNPALREDKPLLDGIAAEYIGGVPLWQLGTWVFYPWSGRLVHLLPRDDFRLLRTDRNRGKISREEQQHLSGRRIGIIGLSVGNSAALTLATEGIAGGFSLADFDTLALSNLNRLRAGVHDLNVNKAVIAARQLFELDPYLDIDIYPDGLHDGNIEQFFTGGTGPIDLLVEECDEPRIKLAAREWARSCRIPVVMDTNDRGMLDIERFDLEPNRPLLHGILGSTTSADLPSLTRAEVIEKVLAMIGTISPKLEASIPRIGVTLSSWPQLASGVSLGGALVADVSRRVLLGELCESGRYYVDLDDLIRDGLSADPLALAADR